MITINIELNGEQHQVSIEDARKLYKDLKEVFDEGLTIKNDLKPFRVSPQQIYPNIIGDQVSDFYKVTCGN